MKTEKQRRIYYQNIVYEIANVLDIIDGNRPGMGIVCGTAEEPSNAVQHRIKSLVNEMQELKDNINKPKNIDWQPMDTAPKDGRTILVYTGLCSYVAKQNMIPVHWSEWGGGVWENSINGAKLYKDPLRWMPMPLEPMLPNSSHPECG